MGIHGRLSLGCTSGHRAVCPKPHSLHSRLLVLVALQPAHLPHVHLGRVYVSVDHKLVLANAGRGRPRVRPGSSRVSPEREGLDYRGDGAWPSGQGPRYIRQEAGEPLLQMRKEGRRGGKEGSGVELPGVRRPEARAGLGRLPGDSGRR